MKTNKTKTNMLSKCKCNERKRTRYIRRKEGKNESKIIEQFVLVHLIIFYSSSLDETTLLEEEEEEEVGEEADAEVAR